MSRPSLWLSGPTRSGKSTWLIEQIGQWADDLAPAYDRGQAVLVFAVNGDNRLRLADRIASTLQGKYPVITTTPNGFIQDEIVLFWPLLMEQRQLAAQFPLRLRPENEQDLAARQWQPALETGELDIEGWLTAQTVRRCLDFLQLAAAAGIPAEILSQRLPEGIPAGFAPPEMWQTVGTTLVDWRDWCLQQGLLTYGVMTELYWRHLLPHPIYQEKLLSRFCAVLADDLDEYPAVAAHWFQVFLAAPVPCAFTWNQMGQVRLGVGADPDYLLTLQPDCQRQERLHPAPDSLAYDWADRIVQWVTDPLALPEPIAAISTLQTTSRGELLRRSAELVATTIQQGEVAPEDVAIIGPGLDAIARYTLTTILTDRGIPVMSLNDQRPLADSPLVRALLTLLTFVYPGLGPLADRDGVAEMLVVLSQIPGDDELSWFDRVQIDPVRAELIADHCFVPHLETPELLSVEHFGRWDRLGYKATDAYTQIRTWIASQQQQRQQRLLPGVVTLLDRAIQTFFRGGSHLPFDQLAALRELMETAQHFWDVEDRLQQLHRRQHPPSLQGNTQPAVGRFIQLLRQGTVTANPYPVASANPAQAGVTIATVFQYRLQRLCHRWHLWLDAGSPRWLTGTDTLFGFPLFLADYDGSPWTSNQIETLHAARLERILRDLLGRVTERVVLCHSDLSVNGQEQTGPLLTLVQANTLNPDEPNPPA